MNKHRQLCIHSTPCVQPGCFDSIIVLVRSVLYFVHNTKAATANYSMLHKLVHEKAVLQIIWHTLGKILPVEAVMIKTDAVPIHLHAVHTVYTTGIYTYIIVLYIIQETYASVFLSSCYRSPHTHAHTHTRTHRNTHTTEHTSYPQHLVPG